MQDIATKTGARSAVAMSARGPLRGLRRQVLWQLGLDIVSGRYPANSMLPLETDILKRFEVSRTVLREATNALAAKGLIEARARIGTRVLPRRQWNLFDADVLAWHFESGPSGAFLESLAEIRLGIEVEATVLAAQRRTTAQVDALLTCVGQMEASAAGDAFASADLEFHRLVAEASANPFMASITGLVEVALASAFRMSMPSDDPTALALTVSQHRRVAEAIRDGDGDAGRRAMRDVIWAGYTRSLGRVAAPATHPPG